MILSVTSASSTNVDDEVGFALEEKEDRHPSAVSRLQNPVSAAAISEFVDFRSRDYPSRVKALVRVLTMERPREQGHLIRSSLRPLLRWRRLRAGLRKEATQPEATNQIPDSVPQQELPGKPCIPSPAQRQPLVSKSATPLRCNNTSPGARG